jgi:hypothetical protein
MNFRIKEYPKGFVVEVRKKNWIGTKYWTHFSSVSGMEHLPYYFHNYENAMADLLFTVEIDTIRNSRN